MGLLDQETRGRVVELLARLPQIGDRSTRRQLLLQDLPPELAHSISLEGSSTANLYSIVSQLDEEAARLADGTWPILLVIERAMRMAPEGTRVRAELEQLLASIGVEPPPALATARGWPRRPPADFTGREATLRELRAALQPGETVRVVALHGMGGAGKTVLALMLVELVKAHYPDAIIDLEDLQPGDEPLPPEALMGAVIRVFQPEARLPDDRAGVGALYLEVTEGRRALLVLDNAASAAQVEPLLELPAGWGVIVTSRANLGLRGAHEHEVEVLEPDEAVALLRLLLPVALASDDELGRLAQACGGLPLALVVAAGAVKVMSLPVGEFADAVAAEPLRHLAGTDQSKSVARVLGTSVTRLREEDAGLAGRWTLLGVFPAPFDHDAAAAVWATDGDAARRALGRLVEASLVDHDRQDDSYRLHDLFRAYARREAGAALEGAERRHARHYLRVGTEADDLYLAGGERVTAALARFERALPHLLAAWERLRVGHDAEAREWVMQMPLAVAHLLDLRLVARQRIPLLETVVEAARSLGDRYLEGLALGYLGNAYAALGEARRAVGFYKHQLDIAREIGDRRGEGNALGNLGIAYAGLGEVRRAISFYEQQLVVAREVGDRRGEGNALTGLGLAYADLGDARSAIEFYQQALVIDREIGDRRSEGADLGNLGRAHAMLGEGQQAIEFCEQSLAIMHELEDRRLEGYALNDLGFAHAAAGEAAPAVALHEQALAIIRPLGDELAVGRFLVDLGEARRAQGETEAGVAALREALAIAQAVGDRWSEAQASWALGTIAAEAGDASAAKALMEASVAYEREIGHAHAEAHSAQLEAMRRQAAGETPD